MDFQEKVVKPYLVGDTRLRQPKAHRPLDETDPLAWSERADLNRRLHAPHACGLPTDLRSVLQSRMFQQFSNLTIEQ